MSSITFKLSFANELRRVTLASSDSKHSFARLTETIAQLFPTLTPGSFLLRWVDEDNDVITIASDDDLNEAIDYAKKAGRDVVKATISQVPAATPSARSTSFAMETEPTAPPAPAAAPSTPSAPSAPAQEEEAPSQQQQQQPEEHRHHRHHHHRHHNHHHNQWRREVLPEFDEQGRPYHTGVTCDGCNRPIYGIRYKCAECFDFDLCEECEAKGDHPTDHVTLKIRVPTKVELYNPYGGRVHHHGGRREHKPWGHHGPWHHGPWGHGPWHHGPWGQGPWGQGPWGHGFGGPRPHCRRWWSDATNQTPTTTNASAPAASASASSSSSSSDTEAPSPSPLPVSLEPLIQQLNPAAAYEAPLQILYEMGFFDRQTNLRLLKENNGNLEEVISHLTQLSFN